MPPPAYTAEHDDSQFTDDYGYEDGYFEHDLDDGYDDSWADDQFDSGAIYFQEED